ncbi:MAG: phosphoglycerate kinase [Candidatus Nealsonbacteria bacterium CG03_land_8_20_14_0_80_36_12]|uniref:Phosphoglycerate kinase n=1 Tax=Candidatus Nealsonbacteria bacterium CG03_land_8_20_14_0_80_36_12 TaxID=1974701 RepID=A0A2M7BYU2_9BACT|nr:MAG: phosphoglycerate kinase [Candidatus Nealsonbacteria bacterium CG03_land_8_20_14_0_80_36_12]
MLKSLSNFDVQEKRVLLRCDFNVPLDEKGNILDDFRIKKSLPTIEYLIEKGAKPVLLSHLGRPKKGQRFSLKPVALRLEELLKRKVYPVKSFTESKRKSPILFNRVKFLDDCIGEKVEKEIEKMKAGEIILLENLRLHKEEEENDKGFAQELAKLGEIFINDAFSVCHREHASIVGIAKFLASGTGFLLEKEIKTLGNLLKSPKKPLISLVGGKKVESKVKLVDKISEISDLVLIGSLIKAEIEKKKISLKYPQKIVKPIDCIFDGERCLSIGPKTVHLFKEKIEKAKTIFWSGPFGKIEEKKYSKASKDIAKAIVESRAFSVVGGGETVEFVNKIGLAEKFNYVSTGGGAMLAFLSGEKLPGIEALK